MASGDLVAAAAQETVKCVTEWQVAEGVAERGPGSADQTGDNAQVGEVAGGRDGVRGADCRRTAVGVEEIEDLVLQGE